MNIHLPAILMFTRGTRFWHTAIYPYVTKSPYDLMFLVKSPWRSCFPIYNGVNPGSINPGYQWSLRLSLFEKYPPVNEPWSIQGWHRGWHHQYPSIPDFTKLLWLCFGRSWEEYQQRLLHRCLRASWCTCVYIYVHMYIYIYTYIYICIYLSKL